MNLNKIGRTVAERRGISTGRSPFKYLPFPHLQTNAATSAVSSLDINYSTGYICPAVVR